MKHIFSLLALLLFISSVSFSQNKSIKTDEIKVDGMCEKCKKRIENAAYIKGVKHADWNVQTKELTVIYSSSKTSLNAIEESIAHAGHNAGDIQATDEDYKKLPHCCAYKDAAGAGN
ncbi:MAG: heavy-metal-associated domain-containing protein [Arachidicoccus sp.]|nr:heavy-metal-associated domain-containing protein [Arachidicoccus sp.]